MHYIDIKNNKLNHWKFGPYFNDLNTAVDHSGNNTVLRLKGGVNFWTCHFYKLIYYYVKYLI